MGIVEDFYSQVDDGKVTTTLYKVRWRGYDRKGDPWEPITHLRGYASMVKAFKESHEKDVERLAGDRRREAESKEAHALANAPKHTVLSMTGLRTYLSVDYRHVSDGEGGILSVHETNQIEEDLRY